MGGELRKGIRYSVMGNLQSLVRMGFSSKGSGKSWWILNQRSYVIGFFFKRISLGSSRHGAAETILTRNHEVVGSIPDLAQGVKDLVLR